MKKAHTSVKTKRKYKRLIHLVWISLCIWLIWVYLNQPFGVILNLPHKSSTLLNALEQPIRMGPQPNFHTIEPYHHTIKPYPQWQDYTEYWRPHWLDFHSMMARDLQHNGCFSVDLQPWGVLLERIEWCLRSNRLSRTRYGFLGFLQQHHMEWNLNEIPKAQKPEDYLWQAFPMGPFSFVDPKAHWQKKLYEKPLDEEDILYGFLRVAMESESDRFGIDKRRAHNIAKWTKSNIIVVLDDLAQAQIDEQPAEKFIANYLQEVSNLTGLQIELVNRKYQPNINGDIPVMLLFQSQRDTALDYIDTLRQQQLANGLKSIEIDYKIDKKQMYRDDSICFGSSHWGPGKDGYINSDNYIFMDFKDSHIECIQEEIIQSFGVGGDEDDVDPSLFNDPSPYQTLTEHDKLLVKLLYDPRIQAGMSRVVVVPIVLSIITEYQTAGLLDNLTKKLYQLR